jgi:hypothetical protein
VRVSKREQRVVEWRKCRQDDKEVRLHQDSGPVRVDGPEQGLFR